MTDRHQLQRARELVAAAFLVERLKGGPSLVPAVKLEAKRRGVSWAAVRVARLSLGILSTPSPAGQLWQLRGER